MGRNRPLPGWLDAARIALSRASVSADEDELNVGADCCGGFDIQG